jgi:ribosomal-protein-alanine N-acetyltransferase
MIVPLDPNHLRRIWLVTETHYTTRSLREHLERYPHLGWVESDSGDYVVGSYWKDRPAIGLIMESSTSAQRTALVQRLLESYRESGSELIVLSEREVTHALPLYLELGFVVLEDVICYERAPARPSMISRRLYVRRLEDSDLPALVKLERETFPWLWWETSTTLRQANQRPNTWVMVAYLDDKLVGYLILAVRNNWGHLNRIGVHPARQSQGFGRELLAVAVEEMARRGATTMGLNTQSDNTRSQHLYESFGFVRTGETFKVYGKWL